MMIDLLQVSFLTNPKQRKIGQWLNDQKSRCGICKFLQSMGRKGLAAPLTNKKRENFDQIYYDNQMLRSEIHSNRKKYKIFLP
jgi:hypothetical protein